MLSSHVLQDAGLALLGVVTVAAAGYVLLRDPLPAASPDTARPVLTAAPSPSAATSTVRSSPVATAVDALLLRTGTTPGGHVAAAGEELGWRVTNATLDPLPPAARLAQQEVVLLQTGRDDADQVQQAVLEVREAAPAARIVVLGPLAQGDAPGQDVQGPRTQVLDPVALGWVKGPEVFAANGGFTPEGAKAVGAELAAELR